MPGFVLDADQRQGQVYRVFGQTVTERVTAEDCGGAYYMIEEVSPPGTGVPPHRHQDEDEVVRLLSGTLEVFLDGTVSIVQAGALLHFPRGTRHGFRSIGLEDARTLWFVSPGARFQAFMRALSSFPEGPPDMARLAALHAAYNIEM